MGEPQSTPDHTRDGVRTTSDRNGLRMGEKDREPKLPPVDPARFSDAVRRVVTKQKPPGGWPGKPPKEVQSDPDDE
jgi:hypothetical protein